MVTEDLDQVEDLAVHQVGELAFRLDLVVHQSKNFEFRLADFRLQLGQILEQS